MARINEIQYVNFYTAGSAAFKYEPTPLPKKKQASLPKMRRKKRILVHVDPITVLGMCLTVVMLVMMVSGMVRLNALHHQQEQMAAYVSALEQENAQLQTRYEAGYDWDEIRQLAAAMGMVPAEQAQRVQIQVADEVIETEPSAWENFCAFLSGLFA